jgi:hypothetical protein
MMDLRSRAMDLRKELLRVLPEVPAYCPDPQCGDSTWDHDCKDGPSQPNERLADSVVATITLWLHEELVELRKKRDAEKNLTISVMLAGRVNTIEQLILKVKSP